MDDFTSSVKLVISITILPVYVDAISTSGHRKLFVLHIHSVNFTKKIINLKFLLAWYEHKSTTAINQQNRVTGRKIVKNGHVAFSKLIIFVTAELINMSVFVSLPCLTTATCNNCFVKLQCINIDCLPHLYEYIYAMDHYDIELSKVIFIFLLL